MNLLDAVHDPAKISDGYHTMAELYEHRIALWIALCRLLDEMEIHASQTKVWRSRLHSDGGSYKGWFLLGYHYRSGRQISYHLPDDRWDECDFAATLDKAPEFDGHTPQDVLLRLKKL